VAALWNAVHGAAQQAKEVEAEFTRRLLEQQRAAAASAAKDLAEVRAEVARLREDRATSDTAVVAAVTSMVQLLQVRSSPRTSAAVTRALTAPPATTADLGVWVRGIVTECGGAAGAGAGGVDGVGGLSDWSEEGLRSFAASAVPSPEETDLRQRILQGLKAVLEKDGVKLFEGGSFAKGTSVKGKSDCDVVLIVPAFDPKKLEGLQSAVKASILTGIRGTAEHMKDTMCVDGVCSKDSCP
jgi:hypothetical protein